MLLERGKYRPVSGSGSSLDSRAPNLGPRWAIFKVRMASRGGRFRFSVGTEIALRSRLMSPFWISCASPNQAGIAPGSTAPVEGEQRDDVAAFDYKPQPLVSEYMKVL